jgi:hypothetical protein
MQVMTFVDLLFGNASEAIAFAEASDFQASLATGPKIFIFDV